MTEPHGGSDGGGGGLENPFSGMSPTSRKIVYGVVALAGGYVVYRWWKSRSSGTPSVVTDTTTGSLGGTTGYVNPAPQSDNSATGVTGTAPPTTDAEWTQRVVADLGGVGYDPAAVSTALGLYLSMQGLTSDQATIVRTAWAYEGHPPEHPSLGVIMSTSGGSTPGTGDSGPPLVETSVEAGWPVGQWISDIATAGPSPRQGPGQPGGPVAGFSRAKFYELNPAAPGNINGQDHFIAAATYRVQ